MFWHKVARGSNIRRFISDIFEGNESGAEESQENIDPNGDQSLSILVKNEPPPAEVIGEETIEDELDISNDLVRLFTFPIGKIVLCKGFGGKISYGIVLSTCRSWF